MTWPASLASRPLLVAESRALEVRDAFLTAEAEARDMRSAGRGYGDVPRYAVIDGVAVIPVSGALLNRYDFLGDGSPYTSYSALTREVNRAAADTSIRAIVLAVSSPGGAADGIMAPAASIRAARKVKPVTALVSGLAASGGFWLAAQAGEIVLADDMAQIGSIGVYVAHISLAGALEQAGIDVSVIHSGEHKVDGHPFAALPPAVRDQIQSEVDDLRLLFAREVSIGRPALSEKAALATEARMFAALDPKTGTRPAISARLADRVGGLSSVIAAFPKAGAGSKITGAIDMDENAIRADERARIGAILGSPEAAGRADQARYLACQTDMSAEAAIGVMANSAKVTAASSTSYAERKAAAGAGGHVGIDTDHVSTSKDIWAKARAGAGWGKAVGEANSSLGPHAISSDTKSVWDKARERGAA